MSTFESPTSAFTIPVGVLITGDVKVLFVSVCVPVVVTNNDVSTIPCTFVVSASWAETAAEMAAVAEISFQFALLLAGDDSRTYVVPLSACIAISPGSTVKAKRAD